MIKFRKFLVYSLMFLLTASFTLEGEDVDMVYEKIRNSGPKYGWTDSVVTFKNEGMTVVCTLTVPTVKRSRPIIITLNGFNGTRDSVTIPGTEEGIFKRTARILAEQGFCSLRLDYRGQGDSDGEYSMTTFNSQISDVMAAIEFVQDLDDPVNPEQIGILGFSQGGLVGGTASARDGRVNSVVLWSAPAYPAHDYEGLLTKEGIRQGLALPEGETITIPVWVDGVFYWDVTLGKAFFDGLFQIGPLIEINRFEKPLMYISGIKDPIVWPQPHIGDTFLRYHDGDEKLVVLDADHAFNFWDGPEPARLDDAIYWSTAWFMTTLKGGKK